MKEGEDSTRLYFVWRCCHHAVQRNIKSLCYVTSSEFFSIPILHLTISTGFTLILWHFFMVMENYFSLCEGSMEKSLQPQKGRRLWSLGGKWDFRGLWRLATNAGRSLPALLHLAVWWGWGNYVKVQKRFETQLNNHAKSWLFGLLIRWAPLWKFIHSVTVSTAGTQWDSSTCWVQFLRTHSRMFRKNKGNPGWCGLQFLPVQDAGLFMSG